MIIYNALIYSLSVLLLLSTRIKVSWKYVIALVGLFCIQIWLGESNYFAVLACYAVLLICFGQRRIFYNTAYQCLCSISIVSTCIILFSSLWLLVSPKTTAFDWVVGALILFTALIWKLLIYLCQKGQNVRTMTSFGMILQVLPLLVAILYIFSTKHSVYRFARFSYDRFVFHQHVICCESIVGSNTKLQTK